MQTMLRLLAVTGLAAALGGCVYQQPVPYGYAPAYGYDQPVGSTAGSALVGAGAGAALGGLAGGGKGAAIGALAGGALGAAVGASNEPDDYAYAPPPPPPPPPGYYGYRYGY